MPRFFVSVVDSTEKLDRLLASLDTPSRYSVDDVINVNDDQLGLACIVRYRRTDRLVVSP